MPVTELLEQHADLWSRAVRHPFLDAVREGSLPRAAFDTWLVQDHHFVEDLLWFQARLLARAPRAARPVLAAGLVALVEELDWFAEVARRRELNLPGERLEGTRKAAELLRRLDEAPAGVALLGLWAIEQAYLDAWSHAAPGAREFTTYVEHWTTPAFEAYVDGLARLLEPVEDTERAETTERAQAAQVVAEVAVMEREFWDMAWGAPT